MVSLARFDYINVMTDDLKKLIDAARTANPTPEPGTAAAKLCVRKYAFREPTDYARNG
jgi:hypothetical protein